MAEGIKIIAENRRARAEYAIEETYEAGIALRGTEVHGGEAWLVGCHISPYGHGNIHNHEPTRTRKLLLHKEEIRRLLGKTQEKGLTLVPMKMYFKRGRAKIDLGRGKKLYDRRQDMKERDANREIQRALRERNKG